MGIREATIDDLPTIINMAEEMHIESRYRNLTFAPAHLGHLAASLIASPEGLALVAEKDGRIIGGMLAQILREPWFCLEPVAIEFGVYVLPPHRGTLAGAQMVRRYKKWALGRGARIVDLGISTGITTERTGEFYEHEGFARCGDLYSLEV